MCSFPGCERKTHAKGMCDRHYHQALYAHQRAERLAMGMRASPVRLLHPVWIVDWRGERIDGPKPHLVEKYRDLHERGLLAAHCTGVLDAARIRAV